MSEELFSVPVSKSPKLRWIEKHRLKIKHDPDFQPGSEDEFGNELFRFYASGDNWKHAYGGDTENEALAEWARNRGVRLWNEEGL